MNKFLNAMGKSVLTILVVLLIGYGWAFIEMKIMLKSYPELFGYAFVQQTDDDMAPDFYADDVAIVKKNDEFKIGDRVLYLDSNNEYKIRLVTNSNGLSTNVKCTACNETESTIDTNTVVGKAVGKLSFIGRLINFFKQKWVLISLAVVGFVFVVLSQYVHEKPKKIS